MATQLMYHPATDAIEEADEAAAARKQEAGWQPVDKHELVAVYHPDLHAHKTVLRATATAYLNRGYYAEPTWVYHPDEAPRMVSADQAEHMLADGWYDSPAKFPAARGVSVAGFTAPLIQPADPKPAKKKE